MCVDYNIYKECANTYGDKLLSVEYASCGESWWIIETYSTTFGEGVSVIVEKDPNGNKIVTSIRYFNIEDYEW